MIEVRRGFPKEDRLYPTDKEERTYRELKEQYGIKDAVVIKREPDEKSPDSD